MAFDTIDRESESVSARLPRGDVLRAFMPSVSDDMVPEVSACLGWLRVSMRIGAPVFLALLVIAGVPGAWSAGIQELVSPALVAAAACSALATLLFAAISRTLDVRDPRGAGRQTAIHGTVAVAAGAVLVGSLMGWITAPSWLLVAGAALAWFGGILVSMWELAGSAARLGASPDVVGRLERRTRSGASVWLVGLAAIAMVAAVGMIGSWYGTKAPVFAIVRLVALALSGYACLGLACWAVVFEVTFALLGVRRAVRDP